MSHHKINSQTNRTKLLVLAALLGALCYISSLFRIPIGPVPFTLQTATVLLTILLLPLKAAVAAQLIHFCLLLLMGGGTAIFLSPSFGFILGFIVAAAVVPHFVVGHQFSWQRAVIAVLIGEGIFYLIGIPYMAWILTAFKGMSLTLYGVLSMGLIPFIIPDLVKAFIAVLLAKRLQRYV